MNERKIRVLTNSGFKYCGTIVSEDENYLVLIDFKIGQIKIPIKNISYIQEVSE